jgi:hypothetical protein
MDTKTRYNNAQQLLKSAETKLRRRMKRSEGARHTLEILESQTQRAAAQLSDAKAELKTAKELYRAEKHRKSLT